MSRLAHPSSRRVVSAWERRLAEVFPTQEAYDAYMAKYPGADKSLHSVDPNADKPGAKPDNSDKAPVDNSGGNSPVPLPRAPPPPDLLDFVDDDTSVVGDVLEKIDSKKAPTKEEVQQALALVRGAIDDGDNPDGEVKRLEKLQKYLEQIAGTEEEEEKGGRSKTPTIYKPEEKSDPAAEMAEEYDMRPEQVKKLQEFAKAQKKSPKKSPAELRAEFIKNLSDPKDKERFKDMSDAEFAEVMKAIGKLKEGSLRARVIRLAYARPDLRAVLLSAVGGLDV